MRGIAGVNQTTFIFASVAFAFLFFVTVRGDLPKWLGLLGLAKVAGGSGGSGKTGGTGGTGGTSGETSKGVEAGSWDLSLPALPNIPTMTIRP
jgi:hypothetical protein